MKKLLCLAAVLTLSFAGCVAKETSAETVGNTVAPSESPVTTDTAPEAEAPVLPATETPAAETSAAPAELPK